jgi:nucleoid-associated protein YgaU
MRLVTKAILLLSLVALGVFVLYIAGQRGGMRAVRDALPRAKRPDAFRIEDPLAAYERWRDSLAKAREETDEESAKPEAKTEEVMQEPHDLESTAEDEGTVVALRTDRPVLGADPPGPTLKPDGVQGIVVSERWRPQEKEAGKFHTIQSGDTLYEIAIRHYGEPGYIRVIQAANPGLDPRRLKVGSRLVLPEPNEPGEAPKADQSKVYLVRKNDTLIGIARRLYGDAAMYRKIYEANRDVLSSPNATLYIGQRLRLPERE